MGVLTRPLRFAALLFSTMVLASCSSGPFNPFAKRLAEDFGQIEKHANIAISSYQPYERERYMDEHVSKYTERIDKTIENLKALEGRTVKTIADSIGVEIVTPLTITQIRCDSPCEITLKTTVKYNDPFNVDADLDNYIPICFSADDQPLIVLDYVSSTQDIDPVTKTAVGDAAINYYYKLTAYPSDWKRLAEVDHIRFVEKSDKIVYETRTLVKDERDAFEQNISQALR